MTNDGEVHSMHMTFYPIAILDNWCYACTMYTSAMFSISPLS